MALFSDDEIREDHPSYGVLRFSRVNGSANATDSNVTKLIEYMENTNEE
jgi:hypothetical protein